MRRRTLVLAGLGCGIGLAGCGAPPGPPPTPQAPSPPAPVLPGWETVELLKAAKRVGPGVQPSRGTYFWRTPEEGLSVRSAGAAGTFQLSTLAVSSGKEQPLAEFNRRLAGRLRGTRVRIASPSHPEGEIRYQPPAVSLSPDGRWLLWYGGLHWTAALLEGSDELRWRQPSPLENPTAWQPDGRHWVELEADARDGRDYLRRVIIHDLQNPQADRSVETPALEAGEVLGFTPAGRLLVRHPAPVTPSEEAAMTEVDLTSETGALQSYRIRLPRPGTVIEAELSPGGDRVAWLLAESGEPARQSLWLSRPDGQGMTLVGTGPAARSAGDREALRLFRWLPRGQRLSFVYGESLYVLALEP